MTDPYSFGPVLGPVDDFLIAEGTHLRLYDKLGAHQISHEGATGIHFAVWAPNARRVSVVGDFNDWDGRRHVDAQSPRHRCVGNLHSRHRRRRAPTSSRSSAPTAACCPLKADPFAFAAGTAAGDRFTDHRAAGACLGRSGPPRLLGQDRSPARAHQHL